MYIFKNNNPSNRFVGDCVIRAISEVLDLSWEQVYLGLMAKGYVP